MVVDEIYDVLVVKFGIGEVFLPKYGKRREVSWKEFIKTSIELNPGEEWARYLGHSTAGNLNAAIRKKYPSITIVKDGSYWYIWLLLLVNKKLCNKCNTILDTENFSKSSKEKSGLHTCCRVCDSKVNKAYRDSHVEEEKLRAKKYREANKDSIAEYKREYYVVNKERISEVHKKYFQLNKPDFYARESKYRASKLNATPNWANLIAIKEIYRTCPTGYHVDHIVPLQNDLVCGLHCEFNLQHLPAKDNLSKNNRFKVC